MASLDVQPERSKRQKLDPGAAVVPLSAPHGVATPPPYVPDGVEMKTCVVCFEDKPANQTVCCAQGHATCDECFEPYLETRLKVPATTNLLASEADAAEVSGNTQRVEVLAGGCHCPLKGHGCEAGPFADRTVAMHVGSEMFASYVQSKSLLPAARSVQQILQKRSELTSLLPNARQCGRCGYGPVEPLGCSDLTSHHGEMRRGATAPVDNSCR